VVYRIEGSTSTTSDGDDDGSFPGKLHPHSTTPSNGHCPRHYQFNRAGSYLIVANQDSDSLLTFGFCTTDGRLRATGNVVRIESPNFVCCVPYRNDEGGDEGGDENEEKKESPPDASSEKSSGLKQRRLGGRI
jgi:hypothetical protein